MSVSAKCKLCGYVPEYIYIIDHLLSGCSSIAATVYKQRHDSVAKISFNLVVPWNHVSQITHVELLWDFNVYADHVLLAIARHPNIMVVNNKKVFVQIINIAVTADCNIINK